MDDAANLNDGPGAPELGQVADGGGNPPPPAQNNAGTTPFYESKVPAAVWILIIVVAVCAAVYYSMVPGDKLNVFATAEQHPDTTSNTRPYTVRGHVMTTDGPTAARVWAIAADDHGNRLTFTTRSGYAAADGSFELARIPEKLNGEAPTVSICVYAIVPAMAQGAPPLTGKDMHVIINKQESRLIQLPPQVFLLLLIIFALSILIGVFQVAKNEVSLRKTRYYAMTLLAISLMGSMVAYLAAGFTYVNSVGKREDILSVGFANIFKGSYAKGVPEEWVFSLTAPAGLNQTPTAPTDPKKPASGPEVTRGFGAPFWVLMMSVLGGCLFTLSLLVKQVKTPVDFTDCSGYHIRLEEILRHQFYVLFSPVGAIFVYQLLVAAEMVSNPVTVALASVAAGVGLNLIMDRALETIEGVLARSRASATVNFAGVPANQAPPPVTDNNAGSMPLPGAQQITGF